MGRINWISDSHHQARIERLRAEATLCSGPDRAIDSERLARGPGELAPAGSSLQRLAVENGHCAVEGLGHELAQSDREDGRAVGRAPID